MRVITASTMHPPPPPCTANTTNTAITHPPTPTLTATTNTAVFMQPIDGTTELVLLKRASPRQSDARVRNHSLTENLDRSITLRHFPTLKESVVYLKEECGCAIVGVEICEGAHALASAPFAGPTAFLLGNEGQGLTPEEMAVCDW